MCGECALRLLIQQEQEHARERVEAVLRERAVALEAQLASKEDEMIKSHANMVPESTLAIAAARQLSSTAIYCLTLFLVV